MTDKGRRDAFDFSGDSKKSNINADKIKEEVEKLKDKRGNLTPAVIAELYNKYPDNEAIVDEILRLSTKRYNKIRKQAKEIAEKVYRKYSEGTRPLHEIFEKMMRYKAENNWSDAEYDEFRKELIALMTGNRAREIDYNQNILTYRSRINRALGNTRPVVEEGLKIKESEQGVLSEILSMWQRSSSLHKSVFMHSLMYDDCSLVAMTGEFKRDKHVASNYIHPIIACMFLPKFDIFEFHMLYSNFGSIIKAKHEKKPIITEPDALLYNDMITDPNDVVCDISSPITDIRNRYKVQISLWETVLKLRSGNYYEANPISDFLQVLNECRNNLYDNADLAYNQDEGAIMRKILSIFSLRPTFIATKPIYTIASFVASPFSASVNMGMGGINQGFGNNFGQSGFPFNSQPTYTVTRIPMLTLQLPPFVGTGREEPINLRSAINQTIWINENKTIVPKEQSIIQSNEVIIFYVNRRVQRIQAKTFSNPLMFSQLPLTMSSFETLNSYPVDVPDRLSLRNAEETFHLRSVVAVNETQIRQGEKVTNIITGTTGLIMTHRNLEKNIYQPGYYLYDPFGASLPVRHPEQDGFFNNKPISNLEPIFTPNPEATGGVVNPSFFDRASATGTIYIYAKPTGYQNNDLILV